MDKNELAQILYDSLARQQDSLVNKFEAEGSTSVYHENRLVSSTAETVKTLISLGILEDEGLDEVTVNVVKWEPPKSE